MINLQPGEKIVLVCRRHWLAFLLAMLPIILLMIIVVLSPILLKIFFPEAVKDFDRLIVLGAISLLEILWIVLFLIIADYYLDVWVVTDRRLIFIELHGLFSRIVSSVTFTNIQDISVGVHGLLETFLKLGDVIVQSAGTEGEFIFKQVPKPYEIKNKILHTREEFLKRLRFHQ